MYRKWANEWPVVVGVFLVVAGFWWGYRPRLSAHITSGIGSQKYLDFYATNRVGMRIMWLTNLSATGFVYTAKQVPYFVW